MLDRRIAALVRGERLAEVPREDVAGARARRPAGRGAPMPDLFPAEAEELVLRDYQSAALDSARENIRKGHRRQILCAPTGAGKTIIGLGLMQAAKRGRLALGIHHRPERADRPDIDGDGPLRHRPRRHAGRRTGAAGRMPWCSSCRRRRSARRLGNGGYVDHHLRDLRFVLIDEAHTLYRSTTGLAGDAARQRGRHRPDGDAVHAGGWGGTTQAIVNVATTDAPDRARACWRGR